MIRIAVVDHSAESRSEIIRRLSSFLTEAGNNLFLLPRISFKPVCFQELRFNSNADLLIIGCEFVSRDLAEISKIKKLFPSVPVVVWLNSQQNNLYFIEQLARQGIDDVLHSEITSDYFIRRLLVLVRKISHQNTGKLLVVDSGKGGVGVTSIVAAIAESFRANEGKVVVVDLDFDSQDLSRFLQTRPFINDNLKLLLDEQRPISEETVSQALCRVWQEDSNFLCMPPVYETEEIYESKSNFSRNFLSVLETIESTNDLVIVDMGSVRAHLQKMLYRVADKILFVLSDDPASLYASIEKLNKIRSFTSAGSRLTVVQNNAGLSGLGNKLLRREFSRAAHLSDDNWADEQINFCKIGQRWPGTGSTLYSQAKSQIASQIEKLVINLDLIEIHNKSGLFVELCSRLRKSSAVNQSEGFARDNNDNSLSEQACLIEHKRTQPTTQKNNAASGSISNDLGNLPAVREQEFDSLFSRPRQVYSA